MWTLDAVDGRKQAVIHGTEGDSCWRYSLKQSKPTSVVVTWAPDPTATVTRDRAVATGCKSFNGEYLLVK